MDRQRFVTGNVTAGDVAIEERRKFVEAWNKTMIDIWQERIYKLKVMDKKELYRSPVIFLFDPDDRILDISIGFKFNEYGLWQDLGTGYGYTRNNGGDLKFLDDTYREKHRLNKPRKRGPKWGGGYTSGFPRERRRWFSTKYYSSVMNLRDFLAKSLGKEFVGLFADLDSDDLRAKTDYYKKKGWS